MTDAEYRVAKKRIEALIEKWARPTGLRWWKIQYEYFRGPFPAYPGEVPNGRGDEPAADCKVRWQYGKAWIRFDVDALGPYTDKELEWVVVHEHMHVFLNEMREEGVDHEERVASNLADAFIWLRESILPISKIKKNGWG